MKRFLLWALSLAVALAAFAFAPAQTTEEAAGQAAEQAGKPRVALTHYVAALQSASEGAGGPPFQVVMNPKGAPSL